MSICGWEQGQTSEIKGILTRRTWPDLALTWPPSRLRRDEARLFPKERDGRPGSHLISHL